MGVYYLASIASTMSDFVQVDTSLKLHYYVIKSIMKQK